MKCDRQTKLAEGLILGLQNVLKVLFTVLDGKQNRVQFPDGPHVLTGQRRERDARRGGLASHGTSPRTWESHLYAIVACILT